MDVVTLSQATPSDMPMIKALYEAAFPPEERRDWSDLSGRMERHDPLFEVWRVDAGGVFAGFVTLWHLPMSSYVEHFAITPESRGKGVGSQALRQLMSMCDKPLLLEVERPEIAPDAAAAAKRIAFYERLGLSVVERVDYVQPSYGPGLPAVPMLLMSEGELDDVDTVVNHLHVIVYNQ